MRYNAVRNMLVITKENINEYQGLDTFDGHLYILAAGASLPALTSARELYIQAAGASLPALTQVGDLSILAEGASLPALTSARELYIQAAGASLPALTQVGDLYIEATGASLPALTSARDLYIEATGASLPALTSARDLYIEATGASLPLLGRVIAFSEYGLLLTHDGKLRAGCRGPFSPSEALVHWNRTDERARIFTDAILRELPCAAAIDPNHPVLKQAGET